MQRDEQISDFCIPLHNDEVSSTSDERIHISENPHPTIIIEESYEPSSLACGKAKIKIHEGEHKLLQGICGEGEREVSHYHKEKYVAAMEDITEILIGEDCARKEQGVHLLDPTTSVVE